MRDLFDIGAQSQPGERQTDIELIIEEKKMATETKKTDFKLKKVKATEWLGNNMGEATAEWAVVGHENYQLRKLGWRWVACDTDNIYEDKYGRKRVTQVCFGYTRQECLKMLAVKIGVK